MLCNTNVVTGGIEHYDSVIPHCYIYHGLLTWLGS